MYGGRAAALVVLLTVAGCGSSASDAPAAREKVGKATASGSPGESLAIRFTFDELTAEPGSVVPTAGNSGSATVTTTVSTASGGRLRLVSSPDGSGIRFPSMSGTAPVPAAALVVRADDEAALSPEDGAFVIGAQFRLEAEGEDGPNDNGNNLVQRGLYGDPAQFKIQIDGDVPSCRVAGDQGEVVAKSSRPVPRGRWYEARCERHGEKVVLRVRDLEGSEPVDAVTAEGAIGSLRFAAGVPLAVGAKVMADGTIPVSASDQFDGSVDEVVFGLLE